MRSTRFLSLPLPLVGALYILLHVTLDWASFVHPFGAFGITPWNPSTGLIFVVVILFGRRMLVYVFAALIVSNLVVRGAPVPISLLVSEAFVVGGGYSVALMVLLNPRLRFNPSLPSIRSLLLLMSTALISSAVVACAYLAVLVAMGLLPRQDIIVAGLRYWVGDMIGIAIVAPFGLIAVTRKRPLAPSWETLLQFVSILLTLWGVFAFAQHDQLQFFYLLFLPVTWIAVRAGLEGASAGLVFIQIGLFAAVKLHGQSIDIIDFQARMLVLAVTGLVAGVLVSERRRAEVALRLNRDALAHLSRLGSMGELAAAIAHEINQPLSAAGTYTGLVVESLEWETSRDPMALELSRKAATQIERAADVIRRLRLLVRIGRSERAPTALGMIIEALDIVRSDIEKSNVTLRLEMPNYLPKVMADRLQIQQVLLNLVRNALEAIDAANSTVREIVVRAHQVQVNCIELSVSDTGPGFPPQIDRVGLTPLSTVKPNGLGIGLSLCRSIAKSHGGELRIRSGSAGATVGILLPTAEMSEHDQPDVCGADR